MWDEIGAPPLVLLAFWHKLNYFLFHQFFFEKVFIICVEFLIKSKVHLSSFE
jgi:hypothetical protein